MAEPTLTGRHPRPGKRGPKRPPIGGLVKCHRNPPSRDWRYVSSRGIGSTAHEGHGIRPVDEIHGGHIFAGAELPVAYHMLYTR